MRLINNKNNWSNVFSVPLNFRSKPKKIGSERKCITKQTFKNDHFYTAGGIISKARELNPRKVIEHAHERGYLDPYELYSAFSKSPNDDNSSYSRKIPITIRGQDQLRPNSYVSDIFKQQDYIIKPKITPKQVMYECEKFRLENEKIHLANLEKKVAEQMETALDDYNRSIANLDNTWLTYEQHRLNTITRNRQNGIAPTQNAQANVVRPNQNINQSVSHDESYTDIEPTINSSGAIEIAYHQNNFLGVSLDDYAEINFSVSEKHIQNEENLTLMLNYLIQNSESISSGLQLLFIILFYFIRILPYLIPIYNYLKLFINIK